MSTIDDIRARWSDPLHCLRESDEQDVRTLLAALDEANARADQFEADKFDESCGSCRRQSFALVERELRELELSVCRLDASGIVSTHDSYEPVWDGEEQDGWSLLQAVDEAKVKQ